MSKEITDEDNIKDFLSMLAKSLASKCVVERIVIGDNSFDNSAKAEWFNTRLDGTTANYYRYFRKSCLPSEIAPEDLEFRKATKFIDKFLKAYEVNNESEISRLGTLFFEGHLKQKTPEYIEYATVIEKACQEVSNVYPDTSEEFLQKSITAMKSTFVLNYLLKSYRREMAKLCLESNMKFSTLEENIDSIIFTTILLTEKYLKAEGICSAELDSMWDTKGFFCDFWFSATLPDKKGNSETLREIYQKISDDWPEYIANAMFILDYAAIIQDRLFSNRFMNPEIDWEKESYNIWNSYAAAALRLGEIFSKYKNRLPFTDEDIAKLREESKASVPLIITEGKTDWKHIKNAFDDFHNRGYFLELRLDFHESNEDMGGPSLVRMCKEYAKINQKRKTIFVADYDDKDIIKQLGAPSGKQYKSWGNNVFSFCLPVPAHREKHNNISIEFYYSDEEIKRIDNETGKRLFFSNEIEKIVKGNLTSKKDYVEYRTCREIQADEFDKKIYDDKCDQIFDERGAAVVHSKAVFADYVYNGRPGYNNFKLDAFKDIFGIIQAIHKE